MSLVIQVKKIDMSKGNEEDNLKVDIGYSGIKPGQKPLADEEREKIVNFAKGVNSGRIKTTPLSEDDFK